MPTRRPRLTTAVSALLPTIAVIACFSGHDSKRDAAGHPRDTDRPPRTAEQQGCATAPTPITTQGIGPVRIGAKISAVSTACETRDSAITLAEGMNERAHSIGVGGGHVIALSTGSADTSITRIIVRDSVITTAKGIHIGSTVGALRAAHGKLCAAVGEGNIVAFAPDIPGVSFEANVRPAELRGGSAAVERDATVIPDAATIAAIWITGQPAPCLGR
ncbi:MAG TPA: hypothetical protein VFN39_12265 [Gemmatimonadaceae bacterium]|nr:hypothetical protein [Gemmatimonadaceae bacterium]